jgi:hypothetical protein
MHSLKSVVSILIQSVCSNDPAVSEKPEPAVVDEVRQHANDAIDCGEIASFPKLKKFFAEDIRIQVIGLLLNVSL